MYLQAFTKSSEYTRTLSKYATRDAESSTIPCQFVISCRKRWMRSVYKRTNFSRNFVTRTKIIGPKHSYTKTLFVRSKESFTLILNGCGRFLATKSYVTAKDYHDFLSWKCILDILWNDLASFPFISRQGFDNFDRHVSLLFDQFLCNNLHLIQHEQKLTVFFVLLWNERTRIIISWICNEQPLSFGIQLNFNALSNKDKWR